MHHPNVVTVFGACIIPNEVLLVMEYGEGESLYSSLADNTQVNCNLNKNA
jgi:hypothetical protein